VVNYKAKTDNSQKAGGGEGCNDMANDLCRVPVYLVLRLCAWVFCFMINSPWLKLMSNYSLQDHFGPPHLHVSAGTLCRTRHITLGTVVYSIERFHMTSRRPYWLTKKLLNGSHIGVPKTTKQWPYWCTKAVLWELKSFLMSTLSFVLINLHSYCSREWLRSINKCGNSRLCIA